MIRGFVGTAVAIAAIAAIALAGCSAQPTLSATGHPALVPTAHAPVGIPDGVVGTADLRSVTTDQSLGVVTFRRSGSSINLEVPSIGLGDPDSLIWALADSPFDPSECGNANVWEIGFPANDPLPPHLDDDMFAGADPSFLNSVLVVRQNLDPNATGCTQPILVTGSISWSIPMQRPWVHPRDHGSVPGAHGTVATTGGVPTLYTTAPDDSWTAIAARFGISAGDLDWLNPKRLGNAKPGEAYAGQILNLDPLHRGNSESRRP